MPSALQRFDAVDALRGTAIVWMTIFHFCFDLAHAGDWVQNFRTDPFWVHQRTAIVSLFLFCTGIGQALALNQGQSWAHFGRRWLQIVSAALMVSVGSWVVFPQSFIYFGVLHGIAVMLLIARLTGRWPILCLWCAGAVALALPSLAQILWAGPLAEWAKVFDAKTLHWLGLVSRKPHTEDYVPVLPWMGVVWWGVASGKYLLQGWPTATTTPTTLIPTPLRPLAILGRWSLSYYLLHQPILMGVLWLFNFGFGA